MKKIKLIGFFLILALPILSLFPWFSPPDWGKTIVFRIILSILIFLFTWQTIKGAKGTEFFKLRNSVPFWLLAGLFGVFLLSTIFSQDPLYSFLGDPHRAGGFLNFGFYIIFTILAFLILQKQDWQKIWDFSIFIGVLVSLIAVFWQEGRPFSTIGNPVLLALYLVLLVFLTISFIIKSIKNLDRKWFFYLPALLLFLYVILITGSRAAYFGLAVGFIYFVLCYPNKKRVVVLLKILFLLILFVSAYGVYYVNSQSKFPDYLEKNELFQIISNRLSVNLVLAEPRFSAWLISLEAIKEKPILVYGPENFSIAFDKHYDPSLSLITKDWGSWYDRAHNFLFDISVTVGVPGLIIFLSLFAVLFWRLQRVKEKEPENSLISHGIQATFLAYFANNLFSFDTFSSYLILFLIVGYSLSLTSRPLEIEVKNDKYRKIIIAGLFVFLIWFIWFLNLKPLIINKETNIALQLKNENCQLSLVKMEENLFLHSFLDQYLGMKYADIVNSCIKKWPSKSFEMVKNVSQVLKKNTEIRPTYTRNWLYLGIYSNFLIEKGISSLEEADYYFKKANELSPKRQEILVEWAKTYFITNDYSKAKEKAQQCVESDPSAGECWWLKGLSNIYLGNIKEAELDLQAAKENRYDIDSKLSLLQLAEAYFETKNYEETRKTAEKIAELFPEMKNQVEEFLETLNER